MCLGASPADMMGMKANASIEFVELLGMPSQLIGQYPAFRRLLEAYQPQKQPQGTTDTWFPRVDAIDGIDAASLSASHGKLIAWGLLRFELAEAQHGLRYQLTPEGKQALGHGLSVISEGESTDDNSFEEVEGTTASAVSIDVHSPELASV